MKLTVNYTGAKGDGSQGPKTAVVEPSADAIAGAASRLGWKPTVIDPSIARQYELKMSELLSEEPDSAERAAIQVEVAALQAAMTEEVANPMLATEYLVVHVHRYIASLFVDEAAVQKAAEEAAKAAMAAEENKAAQDLHMVVSEE